MVVEKAAACSQVSEAFSHRGPEVSWSFVCYAGIATKQLGEIITLDCSRKVNGHEVFASCYCRVYDEWSEDPVGYRVNGSMLG